MSVYANSTACSQMAILPRPRKKPEIRIVVKIAVVIKITP